MALYWGVRNERVWMPIAAAVVLLASVGVALVAGDGQARGGATVDHDRQLIVIAPLTPSEYRVCDGEMGACVPLWSLRAATAGLQEGR